MAACLWKAARNFYCKFPYVECSRAPSVKTCWDLWKEALAGDVAAIRQFIGAIVFVSLEFVKDLFGSVICSVGVCKPETPPPPKEEDLFSWILNNFVEYGTAALLSIAALVQNTLKTIVFRPVIWLCESSFFQALFLVIILSLAILKVFKVIKRRRSSNRTEIIEPFPRDMNLGINPDRVTQNTNELQAAQ
ncbi:hypothetical protein AVEN_198379-1 [Araneus ventricosus]|uniref:Uncharacterized protein n=1 Tax=Araneus ventricosus TaxID=182803 RepID=A0A4Y2FKS8_ARAVE|nr:hypothetical protein AVEN_198379-1 [Araneus ventricosus]